MEIWRSLSGMVEVKITSADVAGTLRCIGENQITVYNVTELGQLSIQFNVKRRDLRSLRRILRKRGDSLSRCRRRGAYWFMKKMLSRPVLLVGLLALLVLTWYLPGRVLLICVTGNDIVPQKQILEAAADSGIGFGTSRSSVRSERVKNELLDRVPQLQWAGINTYGCLAIISVREKAPMTPQNTPPGIASIVATRDGVISELTVIKGTPVCKIGQSVKAGDVLVSGFTNCGNCIRGKWAEAEVYAKTIRNLNVITPSVLEKRDGEIGEENKFSLIVGKKRINLYNGSGISGTTCDKMYVEHRLTLPGGFELPVTLLEERYRNFETVASRVEENICSDILQSFSERYLLQQMTAGRIIQIRQSLQSDDDSFCLEGTYHCIEMIGKTQLEVTLDNYGETD